MAAERRANLVIFEQDRRLCQALEVMFRASGHAAVRCARTVRAAEHMLRYMRPGSMDVFVVGDMQRRPENPSASERIAEQIRDIDPEAVILGITAEPLDGAHCAIRPGDAQELADVVALIEEPLKQAS